MIPPDEEEVTQGVISILISLNVQNTVRSVSVNGVVASIPYSNSRRNVDTGTVYRDREGWMGMVDERACYYTVVEVSGKWHCVASLGQGNDDGDNDNCD